MQMTVICILNYQWSFQGLTHKFELSLLGGFQVQWGGLPQDKLFSLTVIDPKCGFSAG